MALERSRETAILEDSLRDTRMRLKLKCDEVERLDRCLEQSEQTNQIHKLENVSLTERIDLMRGELSRLSLQRTSSQDFASQKHKECELQLQAYQQTGEQLDKAIAQLMEADEEWKGVYVKSILTVPDGPKKLMAIIGILKRLEQKVREVTILRREMEGVKREVADVRKQKEMAVKMLEGGNNR